MMNCFQTSRTLLTITICAPYTEVVISYVDGAVRIMRVGDKKDQIFVYARKSEVFM